MVTKLAIAGALLAAVLAPQAGIAQAKDPEAGFYGGLDIGRSSLGFSGSGIDNALANQGIGGSSVIEKHDTSYGLNLGYRVNRHLAIEGAYARLGDFAYSSNVTTPGADTVQGKYMVDAFSISALGILPLQSSWSLYGKAGIARTDAKLGASSATGATTVGGTTSSNTGLVVGAGVMYDFNPRFFTRAGWDHYADVGNDATGKGSIDTYKIGIGMRF